MKLLLPTAPQWLDTVLADFDRFLLDHAACERKASALAMSLVAHYPDKTELVQAMIPLAREELEHFQLTYEWICEKGLQLSPDEKDPYVGALFKLVRQGAENYFLDRLLTAGIIEARGHERFGLVAEALPIGRLKTFYQNLTQAEARHHGIFLRLAKLYFPEDKVRQRLEELLPQEAKIMKGLPLRAAVH